MLHISRSNVYQLARHGALPSLKIGFARRFRERDVRSYILRLSRPIPRRRVLPLIDPPLQHG